MLERKLRGKRNSTGFRKCFFVVDFLAVLLNVKFLKEMKSFQVLSFILLTNIKGVLINEELKMQ